MRLVSLCWQAAPDAVGRFSTHVFGAEPPAALSGVTGFLDRALRLEFAGSGSVLWVGPAQDHSGPGLAGHCVPYDGRMQGCLDRVLQAGNRVGLTGLWRLLGPMRPGAAYNVVRPDQEPAEGDGWLGFIGGLPLSGNANPPLLSGLRTLQIEHQDRECFFDVYNYMPRVRFPFQRSPHAAHVDLKPGPGAGYSRRIGEMVEWRIAHRRTTDLRMKDLVTGAGGKLKAAVAAAHGARAEVVLVNVSCLPAVIGDNDVASAAQESRCPLVHADYVGNAAQNPVFSHALARASRRFCAAPRLALVGFPLTDFREEIRRFLARGGVREAVFVLPEFDDKSLGAARQAPLLAVCYSQEYSGVIRALAADRERVLRFAGLYGLDVLEQAFKSLGRRLGLEPGLFQRVFRGQIAEVKALQRSLSAHSVGLVLDASELPVLLGALSANAPDCAWLGGRNAAGHGPARGIEDVAARVGFLFRDCGLGCRLFLRVAGRTDRTLVAGALELLPEAFRRQVVYFSGARDLDDGLRRSDCSCVITAFSCDERIMRAGKAPLPMDSIEPGIAGALRTLRRLRCSFSATFFHRYGDPGP